LHASSGDRKHFIYFEETISVKVTYTLVLEMDKAAIERHSTVLMNILAGTLRASCDDRQVEMQIVSTDIESAALGVSEGYQTA